MAYMYDKDKNKKLSYQGDVTVDLLRCQDREAGSTPLTKLNRLLCFVKKGRNLRMEVVNMINDAASALRIGSLS